MTEQREEGTAPVKLFKVKSKSCVFVRLDKDDGMVPVNVLLENEKHSSP